MNGGRDRDRTCYLMLSKSPQLVRVFFSKALSKAPALPNELHAQLLVTITTYVILNLIKN